MSTLCTPNCWQKLGQQILEGGIEKAVALLPDGSVFICGGHRSLLSGNSSAWQLRDGQVSWVGRMSGMRWGHSATPLQDGRVLIAGGHEPPGQVLGSAECYDPRTRGFVAAGSLRKARGGHCATRLASGQVLITGGVDDQGNPLASAELFDPTSGQFTLLPQSMLVPRGHHTATPLTDGRVLLVSGTSAEWYDPGSGRFVATQGPSIARSHHAAALLRDGRVLIAGGYSGSSQGNQSYEEVWNHKTGQIRHVGAAGAPSSPAVTVGRAADDLTRFGLSLTTLADGRVLAVGGSPWNNPLQPDPTLSGVSRLFDPATETFVTLPASAGLRRAWHAAVLLPTGQVAVIGGVAAKDEPYFPDTAAIYCPDPAPVALHLAFAGDGRGSVGIEPGACTATTALTRWYPFGSVVHLTARSLPLQPGGAPAGPVLPGRPAPGPVLKAHHFTGWSGDASGTAPQTNVAMNQERHVTATFQIVTVKPKDPRPPRRPV